MRPGRLILGVLAATACIACAARAQTAREVVLGAGGVPARAVAMSAEGRSPAGAGGQGAPTDALCASMMARRLRGELGALDQQAIGRLLSAIRLEPSGIDAPMGSQVPMRVRMIARDGSEHLVEVVRSCAGMGWLRSASGDSVGRLVRISNARAMDQLLAEAPGYRGALTAEACPVAREVVADLPCPYDRGAHTLDTRTLLQRVYGNSRAIGSGAASVDLTEERFMVRAPRGYDARYPAGLLVWVSAGEMGGIPEAFFPALDKYGLVAIGAENSGNTREVNDRIQLALDGAATAQARFHIDARRIYITGISGGAKVAMMTWACFPDVFAGSIPIVGLASYKDTPAGAAGVWPALFAKPDPTIFKTLAQQRAAVMTGPPDFNYENILPMSEAISRDGLAIRVFEYADMGHTLPTQERFTEALSWIDEPYRALRAEESHRAQNLLDTFLASHTPRPPGAPPDAQSMQALDAVMAAGPWTEAAWKAAALMSGAGEPPSASPAKAP